MSELYGQWKDGDTIQLCFLYKTWEVKIEKSHNDCYFGNGWKQFVRYSKVEIFDILVFDSLISLDEHLVHVCLFKSDDIRPHEMSLGNVWPFCALLVIIIFII